MPTVIRKWIPSILNWPEAVATNTWWASGPPSYLPLSDNNPETMLRNYVRYDYSFNLAFAFDGNTLAPPLNPGETWVRGRYVMSFDTGNNWGIMHQQSFGVDRFWMRQGTNTTPITWGWWALPWQEGNYEWLGFDPYGGNHTAFGYIRGFPDVRTGDYGGLPIFEYGAVELYFEYEVYYPPPNQAPTSSFNMVGDQSDSAKVTVTSTASDPDGDALTYTFDWGDGTSSASGAGPHTHTYTLPGDYTITHTVSDGTKSSTTVKTFSVTIPGWGGEPESPDPDPIPPAESAPPTLPNVDVAFEWAPVVVSAVSNADWDFYDSKGSLVSIVAPGVTSSFTDDFDSAFGGSYLDEISDPHNLIRDLHSVSGWKATTGDGSLIFHVPIDGNTAYTNTDRTPLMANHVFKRIKARILVDDSSGANLGWDLIVKHQATQIGSVNDAEGEWYTTGYIDMENQGYTAESDMDAITLEFRRLNSAEFPFIKELWLEVQTGLSGPTLPAFVPSREQYIYPLVPSVYLSVTPAGVGIPPLFNQAIEGSSATGLQQQSAQRGAVSSYSTTAVSSNIKKLGNLFDSLYNDTNMPGMDSLILPPGVPAPQGASLPAEFGAIDGTATYFAIEDTRGSIPFGWGVGGYGLDVGCVDGLGVEWWLTNVEGWDDGFSVQLEVVEPVLGSGTFVNNVRSVGREVRVEGVLLSESPDALVRAKRRLAGCLAEPPGVGWMRCQGSILPVALMEPVEIEHVEKTRVEFSMTFKGVRAPGSMGMGSWREGAVNEKGWTDPADMLKNGEYWDVNSDAGVSMRPFIRMVGPLDAGDRIDVYSQGGVFRGGGMVLAKDLPSGKSIDINSITRNVQMTRYEPSQPLIPASDYIAWESSRWLYMDPRGSRFIAQGSGSGGYIIYSRELY